MSQHTPPEESPSYIPFDVRQARIYALNENLAICSGLRGLDVSCCRQFDGSLFSGLHTLIMDSSYALGLCNFTGIHTLSVASCTGLTDADFVGLRGSIHTLDMSRCTQPSVSDAAFSCLKSIHTLNMSHSKQITDAGFVHLSDVQDLDMSHCTQASITEAALDNFKSIKRLVMTGCSPRLIAAAKSMGLPVTV